MARELWAKVYVNLRHHPKLIGRPDADFRLWVGLILHAKEHCLDCIVRDLTAADMRASFGIKAPVRAVEEALKYFIGKGMLVEVSGGLLIRDMAERQAKAGDTPEAHAERQRQYRLRNVNDVSRNEPLTSPPRNGMTSPHVSARDAEIEKEKEERDLETTRSSSTSSVDVNGKAPALPPEPWEPEVLKAVRNSLGLTDLDNGWGLFVGQSLQFPAETRHAAAREFLRRNCAKEGRDWPYLIGMMRNGAGRLMPGEIPVAAMTPKQRAKAEAKAKEQAEAARQVAEIRAKAGLS